MADAFKKVVKGQPFRPAAAAWNGFIDAAAFVKAQQVNRLGGEGSDVLPTGVVAIRNDSDEDRKRYEILGIDGVIFEPEDALEGFQRGFAVKGVTPTEDHRGAFVVLLEPIATERIGRAMLAGLALVQVDVAHEALMFADVKPDEATKLEATACGCPIVWKEAGTGDKWAIILVGPGWPCSVIAELEEVLEAGDEGEADAKVFADDGESIVDTSHSISVHGWLLPEDSTIPSGARIGAVRIGRRWYAIASQECPE